MKRQSGITLISVAIVGFFLVIATVLVMKVMPEYIEYYSILQNVKRVAADPGLRGADAAAVRAAYSKFVESGYTKAVAPRDLVLSKEGGVWQISFAYSRTIPLVANASLLLEFEGQSSGR